MVTHWTHWYWTLLILVLGSSWISGIIWVEIQGVAHFVATYGTLQCLPWDITHGSFLCECFGKVFWFYIGLNRMTSETWMYQTLPNLLSIGSMYAIYGNIYHQYTPNVSIYIPYMDPMGYISLTWKVRQFGDDSPFSREKPVSQCGGETARIH